MRKEGLDKIQMKKRDKEWNEEGICEEKERRREKNVLEREREREIESEIEGKKGRGGKRY